MYDETGYARFHQMCKKLLSFFPSHTLIRDIKLSQKAKTNSHTKRIDLKLSSLEGTTN